MHMTIEVIGSDVGEQGARPQSSNLDWVEKLATGNHDHQNQHYQQNRAMLRVATETFIVGTWNVRTLWATVQLALLRNKMQRYAWDILGVAEMRWTGMREINGREVILSGEEEDHEKGVGFMLKKR